MTTPLAPGSGFFFLSKRRGDTDTRLEDSNTYSLFRAKTKAYTSLRPSEQPVILPGTTCYPRTDERWLKAPSAPGFGLSILPNDEKIRTFERFRYMYVFNEGMAIAEDQIIYQTALDHFSLELTLSSPRIRRLQF